MTRLRTVLTSISHWNTELCLRFRPFTSLLIACHDLWLIWGKNLFLVNICSLFDIQRAAHFAWKTLKIDFNLFASRYSLRLVTIVAFVAILWHSCRRDSTELTGIMRSERICIHSYLLVRNAHRLIQFLLWLFISIVPMIRVEATIEQNDSWLLVCDTSLE